MSRVLVARCANIIEPEGTPCSGLLRYRWGESETACGACGARCGIAVAAWDSVIEVDQEEHRCPRCGSLSWVSVSQDGGYTRYAQCVPCGHVHAYLGPGWKTRAVLEPVTREW